MIEKKKGKLIIMADLIARIFVVLLLIFYAAIALVFIVAGIRTCIWEPLRSRFPEKHSARHFHDMKSSHSEQGSS